MAKITIENLSGPLLFFVKRRNKWNTSYSPFLSTPSPPGGVNWFCSPSFFTELYRLKPAVFRLTFFSFLKKELLTASLCYPMNTSNLSLVNTFLYRDLFIHFLIHYLLINFMIPAKVLKKWWKIGEIRRIYSVHSFNYNFNWKIEPKAHRILVKRPIRLSNRFAYQNNVRKRVLYEEEIASKKKRTTSKNRAKPN